MGDDDDAAADDDDVECAVNVEQKFAGSMNRINDPNPNTGYCIHTRVFFSPFVHVFDCALGVVFLILGAVHMVYIFSRNGNMPCRVLCYFPMELFVNRSHRRCMHMANMYTHTHARAWFALTFITWCARATNRWLAQRARARGALAARNYSVQFNGEIANYT